MWLRMVAFGGGGPSPTCCCPAPHAAACLQLNLFEGTCYLTPLLGAWLADSAWGRYKTILIFSGIYLVVSRCSASAATKHRGWQQRLWGARLSPAAPEVAFFTHATACSSKCVQLSQRHQLPTRLYRLCRAWCCWRSAPGPPASPPAQTSRPRRCRSGGIAEGGLCGWGFAGGFAGWGLDVRGPSSMVCANLHHRDLPIS